MLSRIAESLYWLGRYVERAEDTARILDVHVHQIIEDRTVDEATACRALLEAMGVTPRPDQDLDVGAVFDILATDASNVCSIVGSLAAARENARGSREILSSEMWECINATYHALPMRAAPAVVEGPHPFFRWVKERCAIMAGLADSTMTRDDAWRFLVLGRSLERVDMTARLLWGCFCDPGGALDSFTTLRSCSAQEAFLRTYRRAPERQLVAEFLLLDRLFPRSALSALALAERCLSELDPTSGTRAGLHDEARRVLGRARNSLEYGRIEELLVDLPSHLRALQGACADASDALSSRFFSKSTLGWTLEMAGATEAIGDESP